jgi:uncharacterized membrane protein YcaP (DUF421 family)
MSHLVGGASELGWIALKAALLYVTVVFCFRVTERRTLAEMSPFDFVAAIAVGAIVGRIPSASDTSYIAGAITLVTVLTVHRVVSVLRQSERFARVVDPPPRVLVADGHVVQRELVRTGLTKRDLFGLLRQHGLASIEDVQLAVFEQRGQLSIVRRDAMAKGDDLVREVEL